MKRNLVFIIPSFLLLAFLAFKPPAIGPEKGNVIVTTEATVTPSTKPQLRDIDDDREHEEREHDFGVNEIHGHEHHDDDLDEDSSHEDD